MMGVSSEPWLRFLEAAQRGAPDATVIIAVPGSVIDVASRQVVETLPVLPARAAA